MYLTLLETSGNQNYIFSTNKLKENFGASELTYLAGTRWVLEAVAEAGGPALWSDDPARLRRNLLDSSLNRAIESSESVAVEVIVATSGKALLLTQTPQTAKALVRETTARALREAPGLDLFGVSRQFDWDRDLLGEVNRCVHRAFEAERASHPGPMLRSLRLPVIDECATSGLPANIRVLNPQDRFEPISRSSHAKAGAGPGAFKRIERLLRNAPEGSRLPDNLRVLEDRFDRPSNGSESSTPTATAWVKFSCGSTDTSKPAPPVTIAVMSSNCGGSRWPSTAALSRRFSKRRASLPRTLPRTGAIGFSP